MAPSPAHPRPPLPAHRVIAHSSRAAQLNAAPGADTPGHPVVAVLADKGQALFPVIVALRQEGETHRFDPGAARSRLLDRRNGRPLSPWEIHSGDGRLVGPDETVVEELTTTNGDG